MSLTLGLTGLTLTSCCCSSGYGSFRTLARTPVTLDLKLPTPLPDDLARYIYLLLENTIQLGGGDLPELILDSGTGTAGSSSHAAAATADGAAKSAKVPELESLFLRSADFANPLH